MHQEDFIQYLTNIKRYSAHTVSAYQSDLLQFSDYLQTDYEEVDLTSATFVMVRSFVVQLMERGYAAKSVNRKISTLNTFYKFLRKKNVVAVNPAAKMQSLKVPKTIVNAMSTAEIDALLGDDYFTEDLSGLRARAIVELLYVTGIRRSELIGLTLTDVDYATCTLKVIGKGNKTRFVPFPKSVVEVLHKYQNLQERTGQSSDAFFITDNGNILYPKFVYNTVKHYLSFVTTKSKKSPHILRHTYATHLLNKGADVNDIKELLGHANLSATQIYTHNSFEQLKTEYNQAHPRERKNN